MPNHDQKGTLEEEKTKSRSKKPRKQWWEYLEPVFVSIALFTAIVACTSLGAWSFISFSVPPSIYSIKTEPKELKNGQYLQVEYPKFVLGGNDPVYITLTISGSAKTKGEVEFEIALPPGLTLIEPVDQATKQTGKIAIKEPDKITVSQDFTFGVINSQSFWDFQRIQPQPVSVRSVSLDSPVDFNIGIETVPWISARGLVSNTFNERSPLILLVTGFLSGAGALVFQFAKSRRDVAWDEQQKKEKDFSERLKEDLVGAIKFFINSDTSSYTGKESDFDTYKRLIELSGWEDKLPAIILDRLKARKNYEAKQVAESLSQLCKIYVPKSDLEDRYKHLRSFDIVCDLVLVDNLRARVVTKEEALCMLIAYKYWKELKPLILGLIHEFAYLVVNLTVVNDVFTSDKDGLLLLRYANIQKIIIQKIVDNHVANNEDDRDEVTATLNISHYLTLDINWRPLWSGQKRELSKRTLRWLSGHWYEVGNIDEKFSLGSEYAELDNKLKELVIPHPVFELMHGPLPSIVFGEEGMGKTAIALWLTEHYQAKAREANTEGSKVFPVYAPFESRVDIKEWLVEKISRALITFTADNPRRFITASDSQKAAMGRLMLRHTQSVDALRLNFYSSPFINNNTIDIEEVLEYILTLNYIMPPSKLTNDETLNLLYMARPDIFDQIYFLWDIRSTASLEDVVDKIREIEELASLLARQNLIIKIFAPLAAYNSTGNLFGFYQSPIYLTWNELQLRQLIEARIKMFDALWERGIDDPTGLVISSINRSPRYIIRFLIQLMDYVNNYLQEGEKLNRQIFDKLETAQHEGSDTHIQNRYQTTEDYENAVFISYAWGGESEDTVNGLEKSFAEHGISIVRDKKSLGYKGSIEEFEQRIGRGQCIILVISDKYLRSEHCMYELLIANENKEFLDRIFPIVLADAGIYKPMDRLQYIKYWDEKIEELNQGVKNLRVVMGVDGVLAVLKKYQRIRDSFDHLVKLLSDMNAFTLEIHSATGFSTVINAVERSVILAKNNKDE